MNQFHIFSALNYSIFNIILPVNFSKVSYLFAEICDIKSASSSKIILLGIWGLKELLTRYKPFLTYRRTIMRKGFSSNFYYISHRLTDIFDKMFAVGTVVPYSVSRSWNSFSPIWTIFGNKVAHIKVLSRYIHWCLICILESKRIIWNLKLCYMAVGVVGICIGCCGGVSGLGDMYIKPLRGRGHAHFFKSFSPQVPPSTVILSAKLQFYNLI